MKHIQEILRSEGEAEKIIINARKQSEKLISSTKQKVLERVTKQKKDIDSKVDSDIKSRVEELEKDQENILKDAKRKVAIIERSVEKNREKATKILLARVLESGE